MICDPYASGGSYSRTSRHRTVLPFRSSTDELAMICDPYASGGSYSRTSRHRTVLPFRSSTGELRCCAGLRRVVLSAPEGLGLLVVRLQACDELLRGDASVRRRGVDARLEARRLLLQALRHAGLELNRLLLRRRVGRQ